MFKFFRKRRETKVAKAACDAFNAKNPLFTPVLYSIEGRKPVETETSSRASVRDGKAVIDLRKFMGCVLLENVTPYPRKVPSALRPSYSRQAENSRAPGKSDNSSWPFSVPDNNPSWTRTANPEPSIASGGGGNFGGGGASGSWGDSSDSNSSSSDSGGSSDSGSSSSSSSD